MPIVQYRVDGRMMHGQVRTFGKSLSADTYLIINEAAANDPTQVMLLELAGLNEEVIVVSPKDALDLINDGEFDDTKTLVVFKEIDDAVELIKLGHQFKELCIGGMFAKDKRDRIKYEICLFVDEQDKACFRFLEEQGVIITHQVVPDYKKSFVRDLVKY